MRIAYVSRFREGWATERDMAKALRRAGHDVTELAEADAATWAMLANPVASRPVELVIWTTARQPHASAVDALRSSGRPPLVGYHLDRWWGLRRQREMQTSPFFSCDLLVTADGGHESDWAAAGIRHRWLPPAVDRDEAMLEGRRLPELSCDVAFVGSWRRYLPDWPHRLQLVSHLRQWYGRRLGLWPNHLGPVRGQRLADLYASARVVVGDSCLAGGGRYWSDRIPETLGRGGFLLHPAVDGLGEHFKVDEHLLTWPVGDWQALRAALDRWLADDAGRARVSAAGREHALEHHTYDVRARQLVDAVADAQLL